VRMYESLSHGSGSRAMRILRQAFGEFLPPPFSWQNSLSLALARMVLHKSLWFS
jgi:hypothetical protein